jgi:hypothetical protein
MSNFMDSQKFIDAIRMIVRENAINDVITTTEYPPGRRVSPQQKKRAEWYGSLSDEKKEIIKSIIVDAVDNALFGFLCVIDGVRAIENDPNKGEFEIRYLKEGAVQMSSRDGSLLHDLYNSH